MRLFEFVLIENYGLAKREFVNTFVKGRDYPSAQQQGEEYIDELFTLFKDALRKGKVKDNKQKDINYWRKKGFNDFRNFVKDLDYIETKRDIKKGRGLTPPIIHRDDNEWLIGDAENFRAVKALSGGLDSWCISSRDGWNDHFKQWDDEDDNDDWNDEDDEGGHNYSYSSRDKHGNYDGSFIIARHKPSGEVFALGGNVIYNKDDIVIDPRNAKRDYEDAGYNSPEEYLQACELAKQAFGKDIFTKQ